ncbi:ARM repeat-containing protein [Calocera viscosa TUFC12733]|uniref:ARM repeat-containing protein n=1 Tax=Calocera viscosa (strain TUFC12733) TaxID=1330018 RepID=A0A167PHZ9_CALVF|nr:ARM repeat-containing protein [Calocera viscosa TUFC12733]
MSQQSAAAKPSLQGVKIRARKRVVKATAKHESSVFRDQLFKQLETVTPGDFDQFTAKLVSAGATLEYLKYADTLFELLLVGRLLQPGGNYVEDGAPQSPFAIFNAKEPVEVEDVKNYTEVLNKLVRRYKYLQRPLEESSLPSLLQYINKWDAAQREKLAVACGLLMSQGLANPICLQSLSKEHLLKEDLALTFVTTVFKTYLREQSIDHLLATLKRGGVRDVVVFFPNNKRTAAAVEAYFNSNDLPQLAEWYSKRKTAAAKENITQGLKEMLDGEENPLEIVKFLKQSQTESTMPEGDFLSIVWHGLMSSIDWSSKAEQIDTTVTREVANFTTILEPFCTSARTQVALINTVQVYCYDDPRFMKSFPQILKVLYNKDCISDQAVIYWHQKGSKPQGRQHFLKVTEALVKFLNDQDEEEDEEDEE